MDFVPSRWLKAAGTDNKVNASTTVPVRWQEFPAEPQSGWRRYFFMCEKRKYGPSMSTSA
jgi:hypothetical protein